MACGAPGSLQSRIDPLATTQTAPAQVVQVLRRPKLLSLQHVLLALLVMSMLTRNEGTFGDLRLAIYFFLACSLYLLMTRVLLTEQPLRIPHLGLLLALGIIVIASMMQIPDLARALKELRWLIAGIAMYVVIVNYVRSWQGLNVAIWSLVAICVAQALYSVAIVVQTGSPFQDNFVRGYSIGVVSINAQARFYLVAFTFVVAWLAQTHSRNVPFVNVLLIAMLVALEMAMVLLLNRTSLILSWLVVVGLLVHLSAQPTNRPKQARILRLGLISAVVSITSLFMITNFNPKLTEGFFQRFDLSAIVEERDQNRLTRWKKSLELFQDEPLGVGLVNFRDTLGYTSPHNFYLEVLVGLGIQGLTVLVLLLGMTLRRLRRALKRLPPGDERSLAIGVIAAFIVIAVTGMADPLLVVPLFWYVFALAAVLPYLAPPNSGPSTQEAAMSAGTAGGKESRDGNR